MATAWELIVGNCWSYESHEIEAVSDGHGAYILLVYQ